MRKTLQSDVINATTSMADITGLSFPVTAGRTYRFKFLIEHIPNATTTGSGFNISGPASPTRFGFKLTKSLTTATETILYVSNTDYATGIDVANATTPSLTSNIATMEGYITPSVDGTVQGRFLSEVAVAAGQTVKAGSTVEYHEVR